jgi:ABC-2 type transport system ATP-binding protein
MMDMLRRMAADGATIVFSSHILEEVEQVAENVLVIVAGRLAASGDFHAIRRLMTDRPHSMRLRSSDDRRLAAALIGRPSVFGVEIDDGRLMVRSSDLASFSYDAPVVARENGVTLFELAATDESLESVFSYLVRR